MNMSFNVQVGGRLIKRVWDSKEAAIFLPSRTDSFSFRADEGGKKTVIGFFLLNTNQDISVLSVGWITRSCRSSASQG